MMASLMDVTSREICKLCWHVNAVGFRVPDDIWRAVVPIGKQNGVICLSCFTRLADEKSVPWDTDIQFFPVSLTSHRGTAALCR